MLVASAARSASAAVLPRCRARAALPTTCAAAARGGGQVPRGGGGGSRGSSSGSSGRGSSRGSRSPSPRGGRDAARQERQQPPADDSRSSTSSSTSSRPAASAGASGAGGRQQPGGRYVSATAAATRAALSNAGAAPKSAPLPAEPVQVLVAGAGAAGLTAAYFAAQAGAQVYVLERTREAGKKILMSGGSRCNVLPAEADAQRDFFTSSSASALRAVFASWTLPQCAEWLSNDVGLQLALEQETRKWFPASNSSRDVRDRLVAACEALGVHFVYNASVEFISPPSSSSSSSSSSSRSSSSSSSELDSSLQRGVSGLWRVKLASGASVAARCLVLSTGGQSFPAVGTDGTGWRLLAQHGHRLVPPFAALTPLRGRHPGGEQLAGLTLSNVKLSATKPGSSKAAAIAQRGGLLFTHRGFSGPAVLDLSHWLVRQLDQQQQGGAAQQLLPESKLVVDWTGEGAEAWEDRLAAALAAEAGVAGKPLAQLRKGERAALLTALTAWPLPVLSHEGFKKAEVTGGGVPLEEVDCRSMQSRLLPGLFLCGELLDVFGRIGGFNFWWAWLTGRMAGAGAAAAAAAAGMSDSSSSKRRASAHSAAQAVTQ